MIEWAMKDPVIYKEHIGQDGWGKPTYAPDVSVNTYWTFIQKLIRGANGNDEMVNVETLVPLSITPKVDDRFVFEGKFYRVAASGQNPSLYGERHFWTVYCQSVVE